MSDHRTQALIQASSDGRAFLSCCPHRERKRWERGEKKPTSSSKYHSPLFLIIVCVFDPSLSPFTVLHVYLDVLAESTCIPIFLLLLARCSMLHILVSLTCLLAASPSPSLLIALVNPSLCRIPPLLYPPIRLTAISLLLLSDINYLSGW